MKKINYLLVILVFIFLIFIAQTYSKYLSNTEGKTTIKVAPWNIKVNNKSIHNGIISIDDIEWEENATVTKNKIAPGQKGKYKITLDPSGTKVAIHYKLILSGEIFNNDINDTSIEGATKVSKESYVIEGDMSLSDVLSGKTKTFEIKVIWPYENGAISKKTSQINEDNIHTKIGREKDFLTGTFKLEVSQKI